MTDYEKYRAMVDPSDSIKKWQSHKDGHYVGSIIEPPPSDFFLGNAAGDFDSFNTDVINTTGAKSGGKNLNGITMRRSYDGTFSSFGSSTAQNDPANNRESWISFSGPTPGTVNGGTADSSITNFFNTIPAGHVCWVTYIHEPDNNKVGGIEAAFRTATSRIHDLLVASSADQNFVKLVPVVTASVFRGPNPTWDLYFNTDGKYDIVGIDAYEFWRQAGTIYKAPPDPKVGLNFTQRDLAWLIGGNTGGTPAVAWAAARGKRVAIGEYSLHSDPLDNTSRPRRLRAAFDYAIANDFQALCLFHNGVGESGPWWLDCDAVWGFPTCNFTNGSNIITATSGQFIGAHAGGNIQKYDGTNLPSNMTARPAAANTTISSITDSTHAVLNKNLTLDNGPTGSGRFIIMQNNDRSLVDNDSVIAVRDLCSVMEGFTPF